MACLSPSPSGRRLSELLKEKQDPFFLDLHLLEKGCSSRLLDGYDTALCWPAPGNDAAAAVLKRLTSKKNKATATSSSRAGGQKHKQQQSAGLLKLLLSKILHGKAAAAGGGRKKKPAALQCSESFKFKAAAVVPSPCGDRRGLGAVKTFAAGSEVKQQEEEMTRYSVSDTDCDSDSSYSSSDDDEKQLSPVSVLEHPFESSPSVLGKLSPVHGKLSPSRNAAAMADVFRDLLDTAYSPARLTQLLAKTDDLVRKDTAAYDDHEEEDEYSDEYSYGYRSSPKNGSRYDDAAYWEAHKAELSRVSQLVAAEVPTARLDLLAEREDVGACVADAVLEALLRELAVDLGRSCFC